MMLHFFRRVGPIHHGCNGKSESTDFAHEYFFLTLRHPGTVTPRKRSNGSIAYLAQAIEGALAICRRLWVDEQVAPAGPPASLGRTRQADETLRRGRSVSGRYDSDA